MPDTRSIVSFCLVAALLASRVWAVDIETVPVGNPGNAADTSNHSGNPAGQGSVGYTFNIGKYEVTAGQYTEFLNAVAKADTYDLYSTSMWSHADGCKIQRSGSSGSYTYSVASDWANRPVNYVSFWDACRFANWLHNGQGNGDTESGAYTLTPTGIADNSVTRNAGWNWVVTSEDEWYKAAYYKGGSTNAGYWDYPTSSNNVPGRDLNDASENDANYAGTPYPIQSPYYTTVAGEFQNSDSPYGTFDQGGNVFEWNEAIVPISFRCLRGGSFASHYDFLHASYRYALRPSYEKYNIGFRVARFPDGDGDDVIDSDDQCPNTIPGIEVDADGCPPPILGDFDRDGDVDGVDIGAFAACGSGPFLSILAGCEILDFDADSDVDQEDFGIFQVCISGENTPGAPDCFLPPGMVLISAGEFQMGNSFPDEGDLDELPRHGVHVDAFYVDPHELTNYHYCDALNWANSQGLVNVSSGIVYGTDNGQIYCDTTTYMRSSQIQYIDGVFSIKPGRADHPMARVTWYGAAAYANWRSQREGRQPCYVLSGAWTCDLSKNGYRLPTEAEWEKAARGGADGRRFPWSDQDTIQHARANYYSSSSYAYDNSPTRGSHPLWDTSNPGTNPVGFFNGTLRQKADFNWPGAATSYQTTNDANGYGLHDAAGNVLEWCNDWYGETYYSAAEASQANPRGPASGLYRVRRGGIASMHPYNSRAAVRLPAPPDSRDELCGFRLALSFP